MSPWSILLLGLGLVVGTSSAASAGLPRWAASLPGSPRTLIQVMDPAAVEVQRPDGVVVAIVHARMPPGAGDPPPQRALQIAVDRPHQPVYAVQALTPVTSLPVARGDAVFVSFLARSPTAVAGASGILSCRLQMTGPPWNAPAATSTTLSTEWKRIHASGIATEDHPAGGLALVLHLGHQRQTIEIADLLVLNLGPGLDPATLPRMRLSWPGMEPDAPWRDEARRRIERHRMAPLTVRVVDAQARPVPGATVNVRQTARAFQIGSFISTAYFHPPDADSPTSVRAREIFTRLFNRATTPIYWADWGWPNNREPYLAAARYLHQHRIPTRGHVMIYPTYRYMPADAVALRSDPPRLRQRLLEQIREIGHATRPYAFVEYDVTNELRDCTELHQLLGRDVVAEWFAEARRIVPDAKLALNENAILTHGGATLANQDLYLDWYRFLKDRGVAPDVLGFQGHFGEDFTDPHRVWEILDRFAAETDAEFQITEFDINTLDEQAQADYLRDFLTACFAHPRITAFTLWGFWEGDHWLPRAALYRTDFSPKPAARALEALLDAWSTHATLTTDDNGNASLRAFLGTLDVTATRGNASAHQSVQLPDPAQAVTLQLRLPR